MRGLAIGLAFGLVVVLAVGCSGGSPGPCDATAVTLEATVTDDGMTPSALAACRGQAVTLVLDSETDGIFHIHGYDAQIPATDLAPDKTTTLEFDAEVAGQFIIQLHALTGGEETEIGVLTVNEP